MMPILIVWCPLKLIPLNIEMYVVICFLCKMPIKNDRAVSGRNFDWMKCAV